MAQQLEVGKGPLLGGTDGAPSPQAPPGCVSRLTLFLCCLALLGLAVLGATFAANGVNDVVEWGGALSLVSTVALILSYWLIVPWRRHPNPLICYRAVADLVLALRFLMTPLWREWGLDPESLDEQSDCMWLSALTQFAVLSSETWFMCLSLDTWLCLSNPFTSFKRNLRLYHCVAWGVGLLTAVVMAANEDAYGLAGLATQDGEENMCWFRLQHSTGGLFALNAWAWLLLYSWLLVYYGASCFVLLLSLVRLRSGLRDTHKTRLGVLYRSSCYGLALFLYWTVYFSLYAAHSEVLESETLNLAVNFCLASKGCVDLVVWVLLNDPRALWASRGETVQHMQDKLSPQLNQALRREVLFFSTLGIAEAARTLEGGGEREREIWLDASDVPRMSSRDILSVGGNAGVDWLLRLIVPRRLHTPRETRRFRFVDFAPDAFRRVRAACGYSDDAYLESLSATAKERLSEGASGAFFFFSGDQRLIVKSTTAEECAVLADMADEYAAYMEAHPHTLLTRFYGCHSLHMYRQTFSFVVMESLFPPDVVVQARYDIKGSWVNRNAKPPQAGKKVTCRHCNGKFRFSRRAAGAATAEAPGGGEPCRYTVSGRHEPDTVLKDNDLIFKINLGPEAAEQVRAQALRDADFLKAKGIMDYSLLIGVHQSEFDLAPSVLAHVDEEAGVEHEVEATQHHLRALSNSGGAAAAVAVSRPVASFAPARVVAPSTFYIGIIDMLQTWTLEKRAERFAKTVILNKSKDGLSAIEPEAYAARFKEKVVAIIAD